MRAGDAIGKYRLVSRIGHGGMGEVWLAHATGFGGFTKPVVLKTLRPEVARDPLFIEMLAHEARICGQLSHPNLIEVFDFTEHDGLYLLAMEHVVGETLHHVLRVARGQRRDVPAWFALRVFWDCCRGVEYAHDRGIVHCDLSPSNLMTAYTGVSKVLDFGVAHSLRGGDKPDRLKGKFSYMAPERIQSLATDSRTDIYALGVVMYLTFTGQLPFSAPSDQELVHAIVHGRAPRPSEVAKLDPQIEAVIVRAMQPAPEARFQSMRELIAALSPCLDVHGAGYGSQEVAEFLRALFAPQLVSADDDVTSRRSSRRAADDVAELESFDIEVESSVRGESDPAPPAAGSGLPELWTTRARASRPLEPPRFDVREAQTTVQSLFGAPPAATSAPRPRAVASVFEGYTSVRRAEPATAWPWASSRTKSDS